MIENQNTGAAPKRKLFSVCLGGISPQKYTHCRISQYASASQYLQCIGVCTARGHILINIATCLDCSMYNIHMPFCSSITHELMYSTGGSHGGNLVCYITVMLRRMHVKKKKWDFYVRKHEQEVESSMVVTLTLTISCFMDVCSSFSRAALWSLCTISTRMSFFADTTPFRSGKKKNRWHIYISISLMNNILYLLTL